MSRPESVLTLHVVTNIGDKFELAVESDTTVGQIKALVCAMSSRPANVVNDDDIAVKLSVRGVQLQDDDALWCQIPINHASIQSGEKLYASIALNSAATKGANLPAGITGATSGLRQHLSGGGTGASTTKSAREEAEANQRLQAKMMEPVIDAMVQNPQFFESMVNMQPALKRVIDENPEAGRELRNPEVLKQLLMSQLDPDQRRQMNQTLRLQMAQLQNTPGGSAMLEKYFHGVANDASTPTRRSAADLHETTEMQLRPDLSKTSNDSALPNPWQSSEVRPPLAQHLSGENTAPWHGSGSFLPVAPWLLSNNTLNPSGTSFGASAVPPMSAPPPNMFHLFGSVPSASPSEDAVTTSVSTQSAVPLPAATLDVDAAEPDYSEQLVVLLEMGFEDEELCREALRACRGDVDAAVCFIAERQEGCG